jgi:hypothetical protein
MNSPFANLFVTLQSHVQKTVTTILYIDQNLGQLTAKARPPVAWPCLLIDFEDFRFKELGESVQTGKGNIVLTLGFVPHSNSATGTPGQYIGQALNFYDIEWQLHLVLQGWSPGDDFGSLSRISATTQPRTDGYRVRELRYKLAFDGYSTKRQLQYTPASLETDISL